MLDSLLMCRDYHGKGRGDARQVLVWSLSKISRMRLLHDLLLALAREIDHDQSSDASRVLAPLRPVGFMQGLDASSGLRTSGDFSCLGILHPY